MEIIVADVVVLGSGIAGLSTALECAGQKVHVITKATLVSGSSSVWAQGGLAAAIADYDSPKLHAADTLHAGAGLSEPEVTEVLTEEARDAVQFLADIGTRFDLDSDGNFELAREAAHAHPRVLHANKDATGRELVRALALAAQRAPNITIHENARALKIDLDANGAVGGVVVVEGDRLIFFQTRAIVLATGGAGQLYRYTTNPPEATADGLALAARLGAVMSDLEFVQFHPTALRSVHDPLPLVTEALRGAGAHLIDETGQRFMVPIHPAAELAPRDIVARGVWSALAEGRTPALDARAAVGESFPERFPTVFNGCMEIGIDPRREPIPIVPAAHYHMGGVSVDLDGRSSVSGLWACGEVSSTGVHGANRLASNSLLEAVVFGKRVGQSILGLDHTEPPLPNPYHNQDFRLADDPDPGLVAEMRTTMWDLVGLVRNEAGLLEARTRFQSIYETAGPGRLRDRARICWAITEAARIRKESRGAHYRRDYPELNSELKRHSRTRWDSTADTWAVEFEEELVPL